MTGHGLGGHFFWYEDIRSPSRLMPTLVNMRYSMTNIRSLEITFGSRNLELFRFFSLRFGPTEQCCGGGILSLLGEAPSLRHVRLSGFHLTASGMKDMTQNKNLREIQLFHPHISGYKSVPEGNTLVSTELDDMLTASVGSLPFLETSRLDCSSHRQCNNVEAEDSVFGSTIHTWQCMAEHKLINQLNVLPTCISQWKHLKALSLRGNIVCHDSAYDMMFSDLPKLEMLELHELTATTGAVSFAGKHLKNLKCLGLGKGEFSDESLLSLYHHPSLMKLQMYVDDNSGGFSTYSEPEKKSWLKRVNVVYDFLLTLHKIRKITLESCCINRKHTGRDLPVIESAEIEIVSKPLGK